VVPHKDFCDTPELWRGAAGALCARVRACAGAAEYLHIYAYVCPLGGLLGADGIVSVLSLLCRSAVNA